MKRTPLASAIAAGAIAAAITLGSSAIGYSAIAAASPNDKNNEWDIEQYDDCMNKTVRNADLCCADSGGTVGKNYGDCTAPAPRTVVTGQPTAPPRLHTGNNLPIA